MLLLTINRNPSKGGQQKGSCTFSQRAPEEVAENLASAPRRQQLFLIETDRLFSAPDLIERCTTACAGCRRVAHDAVRCRHLGERRSRMTDLCARLFSSGCGRG